MGAQDDRGSLASEIEDGGANHASQRTRRVHSLGSETGRDGKTEPDDFVRRSAAFAFDDVTERLEGRPPELQPTPAILAAVAAALPPLRDAALHDNDDIVRCVSYESLGQASRSKHKALREPARKLMKGQRSRCK